MKKSFLRILALAMAMVMALSIVTVASADTETRTIKILHLGPKPDGWDAVYEEYLNRTATPSMWRWTSTGWSFPTTGRS